MKKMRKGFTLVELLIVVAILATLAAVMTASVTGQTAKAKASAIMNNVDALKKAAGYYYADHWDDAETMKDATTTKAVTDYVKNFSDLSTTTITYAPDDAATGTGIGTADPKFPLWNVTVTFTSDGEAAAISTELQKHPGYKTALVSNGTAFKVALYTGEISAVAAASNNNDNNGGNNNGN